MHNLSKKLKKRQKRMQETRTMHYSRQNNYEKKLERNIPSKERENRHADICSEFQNIDSIYAEYVTV